MAFRVIKGTFHIAGYAPDGDSVRFKAANPAWWSLLDGPKVGLNAKQHAQLRIEAIDTLETHFETFHQPLDLADQATEFLLRQLGITEVQWNATRTKVTHARDGTPGFIITRTTERNRRPVAFVYAGRTERADGSEVFLDRRLIRRSINYRTLWAGMAYPTYYQGLFYDLRDTLTSAVLKARAERLGVWRRDRTTRGFEVDGVDGLMNVVVLPKFFRRLVVFLAGGGALADFKSWLAADPDPVLLLGKCHFTNLDTFVEVKDRRVHLTVPAEQLVFDPT